MNPRQESSPGDATGRREWLGKILKAAACAPALAVPIGAAAIANRDAGGELAGTGPMVVASSGAAIVETRHGRVQGYISQGISTFKGIPYGRVKARFEPAEAPEPWAGIRSSLFWGPVCPQEPRTAWSNDELAFVFEWEDGQPGEDCLRLNVWTPSLDRSRKRPVMVWLHGGAFGAGCSQEHKAYDGENLSRRGDIVFVSINHRIGALGYMNLAGFGGERYATSGNVGMLDIVRALEWVRDNITEFGGDPANVTIFGQSGGAGKVTTLMGMPSAAGLFHRGIAQSPSMVSPGTPGSTERFAAAVFQELGLRTSQVEKLAQLPVGQVVAAGVSAARKQSGVLSWAPVVDGKILPRMPFEGIGPAASEKVPLMLGTTLNEGSPSLGNPQMESLSAAELRQRVVARHGAKAEELIRVFSQAFPGSKPVELLSYIQDPRKLRTLGIAKAKAVQKRAPAFLYWFCWQPKVLDGRLRAFHCLDIPFATFNTDRSAHMTGGTDEARQLGATMSDAWLQFARTGDPNHQGLPHWPKLDAERVPTMIFDNRCRVEDDPAGAAWRALASA